MNVFAFTRIKLTALYVAAIMAVSIMFSVVIYSGITRNVEDVFFRAEQRMRNSPGLGQQVVKQIIEKQNVSQVNNVDGQAVLDQFFIEELKLSKRKVFNNLLYANLFILLISSIVSYALASKTLKPIEQILLEQKRFIADASHELRTPLTSLKTAIEVSLRDKALPLKSKKILQDNLADVNSLQNLIDSLLQLASQENKTIVKQLIDVHEILSKAIKTVRPLAKQKNIKIISKLSHQQILASDTGLNQLFTILLDNAIKYSNPKGKIHVILACKKRQVIIKIKDSGIGINKKYLKHIFDRFYRIDDSRTVSLKPGYGLGLSVAKQIVQNHSGEISVMSESNKGSTFIVKLPI
jgi:two-component system, OmpR family, sensor histidine kinase CiaH